MAQYLVGSRHNIRLGLDDDEEGISGPHTSIDFRGHDNLGRIAYVIDVQRLKSVNIPCARSGKADCGIAVRPFIDRVAGEGVHPVIPAYKIDRRRVGLMAEGLVLGCCNRWQGVDRIVAVVAIQAIGHIVHRCRGVTDNLYLRRIPEAITIGIFIIGIEVVAISRNTERGISARLKQRQGSTAEAGLTTIPCDEIKIEFPCPGSIADLNLHHSRHSDRWPYRGKINFQR